MRRSNHGRRRCGGGKVKIGTVRRVLMIKGNWKWNAWVRDITAKLELRGWFV